MAETKAIFRNAVGGYNKDDVNNYISKLVARYNTAVREHEIELSRGDKYSAEAREELARLGDRVRELETQLQSRTEQIGERDAQIAGLKTEAAELRDRGVFLENEAARFRSELEAREGELAQLRGELTELREKMTVRIRGALSETNKSTAAVNAGENDGADGSLSENASLYEQLSAQIGQTLLAANRTAGEIIENAQREAGKIIAETRVEITAQKDKASKVTASAVENVTSGLRRLTDEYITDFKKFTNEANDSFTSLIARFNENRREMSEKASGMADQVSEIISGELSALNDKQRAREKSEAINPYISLPGKNDKRKV